MEAQKQGTSNRAWAVLVVVYLLSVTISLVWFSVPPLHNPISGLVVNGEVLVQPGYTHFSDALAVHNFKVMADFGLLMSYLSIAALVAAILTAPLIKRFGAKSVLVAGSICTAAACAGSALSGASFELLLGCRIVNGLGVGFIMVSSPTVISLWFSDKNRALAVAIWSTCVPLGILIINNVALPLTSSAGDFHDVWWVVAVLAVVACILTLFIVRNPEGSETTEVGVERKPFREIWPVLRQHQLLAVCISWLAFNFVNYCLGTYNVAFFTGELAMDPGTANFWGGIASGAGIAAPLFGALSDRINRNRKYLLIAVGAGFLALAAATAFKVQGGMTLFALYMVVQVLGNAVLVATCRPMVPILVGRGGVMAVSFGLSLLAFLQYGGQMFMPLFGTAIDNFGFATATWMVAFPVAAIGFVAAFLVKPSKSKE